MLAFIARRLLLAAFTVWAITVLSFIVIQLPEGDAADRAIERLMTGGIGGGGGYISNDRSAGPNASYGSPYPVGGNYDR